MSCLVLASVGDPLPGPRQVEDLADLVGLRGAFGETRLTARGFVNRGGREDGDRVRTYWWHPARRICATVVTEDGRYVSITSDAISACQAAASSAVEDGASAEELRFARGATGARREGVLAGRGRKIYQLTLRAGQAIRVDLDCAPLDCAFDVSAPRSSDVMHRGILQGRRFRGRAPLNGVYRIEVYRLDEDAAGSRPLSYVLDVSAR